MTADEISNPQVPRRSEDFCWYRHCETIQVIFNLNKLGNLVRQHPIIQKRGLQISLWCDNSCMSGTPIKPICIVSYRHWQTCSVRVAEAMSDFKWCLFLSQICVWVFLFLSTCAHISVYVLTVTSGTIAWLQPVLNLQPVTNTRLIVTHVSHSLTLWVWPLSPAVYLINYFPGAKLSIFL